MHKKLTKLYLWTAGLLIGTANGIFGSGGGIIAVPMLKKYTNNQKKAHATSIAVTLPLSIISTVIYSLKGNMNYSLALKFIPFGISGAIIGSKLLKRLSNKIIRKIFAAVMIYFGFHLVF